MFKISEIFQDLNKKHKETDLLQQILRKIFWPHLGGVLERHQQSRRIH